jgi:hypothetical protein
MITRRNAEQSERHVSSKPESETVMKLFKSTLSATLISVALIASGAALAQPAAGMHHQPGERVVKLLNLDATRAAQVTTIMTEARTQRRAVMESMQGKRGDPAAREGAHAQMKAIHEGTEGKLARVLTPDEMAKLKEARKGMHGHGHGMKQG